MLRQKAFVVTGYLSMIAICKGMRMATGPVMDMFETAVHESRSGLCRASQSIPCQLTALDRN